MASGGKCQIYGIVAAFYLIKHPFLLGLFGQSNFLPHKRNNVEQKSRFQNRGWNHSMKKRSDGREESCLLAEGKRKLKEFYRMTNKVMDHHYHHHLCQLQVGLSSMTTKVTERDNEALAPSFSFLHNLSTS